MRQKNTPAGAPVIIHDDPNKPLRRLTLNQPARRNCLDLNTMDLLIDAIQKGADRQLLLTGTPPAFCAGLDLKEIIEAGSPETHLRRLVTLLVALSGHPNTTTCYVQGPARAGGVALACCTDHVIAHPNATFMIPGENFYRPMAATIQPILAARRGLPLERTDALPGHLLSAETARSLGLIDEVNENQEEVFTAPNRPPHKTQPADAKTPRARAITPAALKETGRRIDRATKPDAVAPLIQQLNERYDPPD